MSNPLAFLNAPKAKRGAAVQAVTTQLRGAHLSITTPPIMGATYTLHTLEPSEMDAAHNLLDGTSFAIGQALRRAYLAWSIDAINGSPIEVEFAVPADAEKSVVSMLEDKAVQADWRRREIYNWLTSDAQDELIAELWTHYAALAVRKKEALDAIRPTSPTTTTGPSSPMSSPGKES